MLDKENKNVDHDDPEQISRIDIVGIGLMRLAEEQIGIRQVVEDRWLANLEQFLGNYDATTSSKLQKTKGSRAFVNNTRSKTNAAEARLSDMLFPTDDRNWGIKPTPVPDIGEMTNSPKLITNDDGVPVVDDESGEQMTYADHAEIVMQEARDRADLMQTEIADQLSEANYQDVCRDLIHDGCLYGSGVIKAPIVINRTRKKWEQEDGSVYTLSEVSEYLPGVEHVKIWDFFPDMSATTLKDCIFTFERRFVSKKQLITLSKRPGYNKEQIAKVIIETPAHHSASGSSYIAKLRELSNLSVDINKGKYELWEYNGPLSTEDIMACGCKNANLSESDDPLEEHNVVISFIGNYVIKADLSPMETGENPYSMFIYERDDSSIFGVGIPHIVRHEQRVMNSAWRMLLDNAGLSTGPQIIINEAIVTPVDGVWTLSPKKVWLVNDPEIDVRKVFATFEINSHQAELSAIYEMSKIMMDEVTNLPLLAQGEVGEAPDTMGGMSMLLNSSNIVLRRIVKGFDDDITVPVITRFYDWNMQNNEKEEIKGDYSIDARGSSTLLVKETQQQALLMLMKVSESPTYGPLTKHAALYRKTIQAQHLVADDIVYTDDEIKAKPQQPSAGQVEAELKINLQQMEDEKDINVAQIRSNSTNYKTDTTAGETKLKEDNKANLFMAEVQVKNKYGEGI